MPKLTDIQFSETFKLAQQRTQIVAISIDGLLAFLRLLRKEGFKITRPKFIVGRRSPYFLAEDLHRKVLIYVDVKRNLQADKLYLVEEKPTLDRVRFSFPIEKPQIVFNDHRFDGRIEDRIRWRYILPPMS